MPENNSHPEFRNEYTIAFGAAAVSGGLIGLIVGIFVGWLIFAH